MTFVYCGVCFLLGVFVATVLMFWAYKPYDCDGDIVMHGDEIYLALSEEDKKALESKHMVILRLVREKFNGFSGN